MNIKVCLVLTQLLSLGNAEESKSSTGWVGLGDKVADSGTGGLALG